MWFVFDGGSDAESGVDAAAVVEVFDPGGDSGVDLVASGEGTPVVVLGCEGGPQGLGHGVIPAHCGPSYRYGSFHGAHVGGQFLGGELCSPISMQHDPTVEAAAGGGGHVDCGGDQVGAVLLAHGVSQDTARVRIAHGAQVDPAVGAAQVGDIRDPHPVQATVIPLAGAVVLIGHCTPSAAPGRARARVQACEAQATHRRAILAVVHVRTGVLALGQRFLWQE